MLEPHAFLTNLALVLCIAAVTTVTCQRLHLPVVLGYLIAGLVMGPHLPIPVIADQATINTLSHLGVILLMFSIGLEFRFRKLFKLASTGGIVAAVECSMMAWIGFVVGRTLGWTVRESVFTGAMVAISSTTIIAKAFDEKKITGKIRELVFGILIVEDLVAILLLTVLTALAAGDGVSAGTLVSITFKLIIFLIVFIALGMLVVPWFMRYVVSLGRVETTLVASIGICFAGALLAERFGYSVALGAFVAGSLIAESGESKRIERLVTPVRDMFTAIFFVSVGMLIEPKLMLAHWQAILALVLVVIVGKTIHVFVGAFLTGAGVRTSIQAGLSLSQIGEFSFIIAGLGLSTGAVRPFLYPIAVAVSAVTTLTTPLLIDASNTIASYVDRKLPHRLQTFATLYGAWVEELQKASVVHSNKQLVRSTLRWLALDSVLLIVVVATASVNAHEYIGRFQNSIGIDYPMAKKTYLLVVALLCAPFVIGIHSLIKHLGVSFSEMILPLTEAGTLDVAAAPRRALVVSIQLAILMLIGAPLVAMTQPFLPGFGGAGAFAFILLVVAISFWRSATKLQGHVRTGAERIVSALASQSRATMHGMTLSVPVLDMPPRETMTGLGTPEMIRIASQSPGEGKTLAQINLRGLTGATVLVIRRDEGSVVVPTAQEKLKSGDVLVVAGTHEAIAAANQLLAGHEGQEEQ